MLREELLQSKNDEIARCLLSRKRKLSELYFATVGFAGATESASADPLYNQKEQAFLDANDLSKGHFFNEATLPPFSNYAALRQREIKETAPPAEVPSESNNATPISPPAGRPSAPQPVASTDRPKAQAQQLPDQKPATPAPEQLKATQLPTQPPPAIASETPQGPEVSTPVADKPTESDFELKIPQSIPQRPTSTQGQEGAVGDVSPAQSKPNRAVDAAPGSSEVSSLRKDLGKRSSVTTGSQVHVEQPLSPISSGGPYSSNTPIPAGASPDTSPAEDSIETSNNAVPEQKPETPAQAPPTLVPSTPDEQLRLEEAQSLQQNTLAASKAIGDDDDDLPSTNEVIQENVVPALGGPEDSSKKREESVSAPAPPEPIKPEGAIAAAEESPALSQQKPVQTTSPVEPTAGPATPLSKKDTPPAPSVSSQPERMITRVSSGAIRHKSVSEILGETPKSALSPLDKGHATEKPADGTRSASDSSSTSAAKMRLKDRKAREKERSKLSTVVFPKQPPQPDKNDSMDLIRQQSGELARLNEEQDYLYILFQNRAYTPPRGSTLNTLLASAHKTLTTENHLLEYHEQMDSRTLRRIYALQNANRWPLRQLKRSVEPPRQGSHWDVLLDHMKWMRTDFREERKWKIAAAKSCADWCAEFVNSDQEHRSLLRVNARISAPKLKEATESNIMSPPDETGDEVLGISHPTPDLVPSMEDDSLSEGYNDEPRHDLHDIVAPAAIFSLGSDEFNFSLDMTPAAQKLLDELPIYAPVNLAPDTNLPEFKEPPDSSWKTELLPLSKYVPGKIAFNEEGPPRKRSRYDYSQYQSDPEHRVLELPPEQTNVALFRPENKHIRDRIHPGHGFRPPAEYSMPSVGFFESRNSSQWTYAEDDELRRLVKEYAYNWSLISSCLTHSSQFTSGAERRTPWECFERWVGLEGLPADLSKTQYFRAYHQRLETAQRTVLAQQQAAQQQQQQQQQQQGNANPQAPLPVRRRTTQPVRVDRRRSSKHLAMLDAMRKLAKKRETMLQKQQHASQLASLRKVNEANQPKPPLSTPAEFSRLKYERDVKLQERQEHYRQQMIAQQRANLAAQRAGQIPNQQQMMNAPGRNQNGVPNNPGTPAMPGGTPNGMPNGMPNGLPNGLPNGIPPGVGVNSGRPQMQGMPGGPVNSSVPPNPMAMKMMPQSGMAQNAGNRTTLPMQTSPDNARVLREANRLQEQQRVLQSRQQPQPQPPQQAQPQHAQQQFHNQQQFVPQGSHSPNLNMSNTNGAPNNPAMMAALQAGGGMQSPSFPNGTPQGVSTPSPRMGQPNLLSNGVVPTISSLQNQIQRNNPNMTPEQVNKLATDRLHQYQQSRMSQVAMTAAAGNIGAVSANYQVSHDGNFQPPQSGMNGGPGMQVPQAQGFSPMMRVAQNTQQGRVGVGSSPAMNGTVPQPSRSATPQNQRSGSAQAGPMPGSSKSPNPPQAQTAGN
ncbi:MYB and HSA domain protein [Aspergillus affinis]|uniref:MYB and HSA domain protein n=1 Tax=Aspergillus affinis TaxID=1070780 RepID=UPI0022FF2502|nr:chromatin modification- protein VID21 [Aspergillus affinis]KAI9042496.1 chromatin modification- protein VID21 [Aspergillus affinis]